MDAMEKWLQWAVELQSLAQAGLTYGRDIYDKERYERIREISAEMVAFKTGFTEEKVKNLFCGEEGYQTPKMDTRAAIFEDDKILLVRENNGTWSLPGGWADVHMSIKENIETTGSGYFDMEHLPNLATEKNTEEQIRMCFDAYHSPNWIPPFD